MAEDTRPAHVVATAFQEAEFAVAFVSPAEAVEAMKRYASAFAQYQLYRVSSGLKTRGFASAALAVEDQMTTIQALDTNSPR